MANDFFAGLMGGLGQVATAYGQNLWQDKQAEKALLRQQALNRQEADLRQQALEAEMKLRAKWQLPEVTSIEVDGPDGRRVKRAIQTSRDPETGQVITNTLGESALPLEPNKSRTIRQGGMDVTQEFDPRTGKWTEIGRGAAFAPREGRQPNELQTRMAIAEKYGATPDDLRALALGTSDRGTNWEVREGPNGPVRINKATGQTEQVTDEAGKPVGVKLTPSDRKQVNAAVQKLGSIDAIEAQLNNVQERFDKLKGTMSAGGLQGWVPTESGQQFDKAVAALSPLTRQLTRVPGEGAQSDYEAKLLQAAMLNRGSYESTTQDQIEQMRELIQNMRTGHQMTLESYGQEYKPKGSGAGKYQVGQIIEQGGKKYRVTGGDPNDPDVEEVK